MTTKEKTQQGWWERLRHFLKSNSSLTVIIAAAILLQAISAVQYYYTRSLLTDELEKRAESEITSKAIIVKSTLNMAEISLNGHVWDMKHNIAYPDSMFSVAEWMLRSNPNLLGCGIAFLPDFYPEKGRLFEPYVYRTPEGLGEDGFVKKQAAGTTHDYTQMGFYKVTMSRNSPFWSYPYYLELIDKRIVTYCRPIHNEKKDIVAVFGLDIDTKWLGDTLNYRHIYPSSYNFLLTETGQLIAGPNHLEQKKKEEMEHIIKMINDSTLKKSLSNSGRSTIFRFKDLDGDKGMVLYAFFKGKPRWQIAVVCYDKEIYAKLHNMRLFIGILMLLGLLVLGLIISRFAKNSRKLQKANIEKERIDSELRIATEIQKEMLPKIFPPYPERGDIDIYGMQIPAREVGGDIYDFFIRDEKLFFCIGDVSGKGVPSAIVMAVIHAMFRMASSHENNPARIMQTINEAACERNESNIFVTLFVGVLDLPTGHLRYCDAGHDAPIVLGNSGNSGDSGHSGDSSGKTNVNIEQITVNPHLPVGVFDDVKYNVQETHLQPDSTIFLYTDGLTEAKNEERKQFGLNRVKAVLGTCTDMLPKDILEKMTEAVHGFVKDATQSDDLTMLAIRYTPSQFDSTLTETLTMKNDVHEVARFSSFIKAATEKMGIEKSLAQQLRLAVEEAVVNVIDYAYPAGTEGNVEVRMMYDGSTLRFMIIDSGMPFDPTMKEKADITLSAEERQIGGLGILLVRELMDSINYERIEGKNILTLLKKLKN